MQAAVPGVHHGGIQHEMPASYMQQYPIMHGGVDMLASVAMPNQGMQMGGDGSGMPSPPVVPPGSMQMALANNGQGSGIVLSSVPTVPGPEDMEAMQSGTPTRFKPTTKQREEMEQACRAGQFKRKCKELEDYALQENLPYKAVLSWFDRNKQRIMAMDVQPEGAESSALAVVSNVTPQRFKPTPDQIQGFFP